MKHNVFAGILIVLAIIAFYLALPNAKTTAKTAQVAVQSPAVPAPALKPVVLSAPVTRVPAAAPVAKQSRMSEANPENHSLDSLGHTLSQVGQPSFTLKGLLEDLQKTGQQPLVVRDANPDTGEMLIVRTKSPLPGTRYFHAQYFTDEDGARFVQHMSFEFKPGPDAMAAAVATVERNFPNLSRPVVQRADYVKWILDNHYIVWVKKMAEADLQEDPFNSYSVSDNGTIRVAVELEIHGD